jgi:hypothetical protein
MGNLIANIIIIVLIVFSIISWILTFYNKQVCPQTIIYREPQPPLDIQFNSNNLPTIVYKDLFTGGNTWIGGYKYVDYNNKSQTDNLI